MESVLGALIVLGIVAAAVMISRNKEANKNKPDPKGELKLPPGGEDQSK